MTNTDLSIALDHALQAERRESARRLLIVRGVGVPGWVLAYLGYAYVLAPRMVELMPLLGVYAVAGVLLWFAAQR